MTAFVQPEDIVNRALQILEIPRIVNLTDFVPAAVECNFVYDKIRRMMLTRHLWTFATRRVALRPTASTTVLLAPAAWAAGTYPSGSIVSYNGIYWIAQTENATGTPGAQGSGWDQYFGPITVTPWNVPTPVPLNTQATDVNPYLPMNTVGQGNVPYGAGQGTVGYWTGELTYLPKGDGTYMVFRATITSAGTNPAIPSTTVSGPASPNMPDGPLQADPWDASTTYAKGQLAVFPASGLWITGISFPDDSNVLGPQVYQSTVDLNTGNEPDLVASGAALTWQPTHSYSVGDYAWGSDNQVYQCLVANTGNNPVTDTLFAYWLPQTMWVGTWTQTITPSPRAFSNGWQYIAGTLSTLVINYPLTAGPVDDTNTLNAYRLPANFLRTAPDDPKMGGIGWLGAPSGGNWFDDRVEENGYIVSQDTQPIIFRFVTDMVDVSKFHDLFCEAMAADIARAVQPILKPERNDLFQRAQAVYDRAMADAALINAIEVGSVEPPVDTFITCRL